MANFCEKPRLPCSKKFKTNQPRSPPGRSPSVHAARVGRRQAMLHCRVWLLCTSLAGVMAFSGCALMNGGKSWWTGLTAGQSEPELDDSNDRWANESKGFRAGRPVEKT